MKYVCAEFDAASPHLDHLITCPHTIVLDVVFDNTFMISTQNICPHRPPHRPTFDQASLLHPQEKREENKTDSSNDGACFFVAYWTDSESIVGPSCFRF
jgi:hypothetical protein